MVSLHRFLHLSHLYETQQPNAQETLWVLSYKISGTCLKDYAHEVSGKVVNCSARVEGNIIIQGHQVLEKLIHVEELKLNFFSSPKKKQSRKWEVCGNLVKECRLIRKALITNKVVE